MSGRAGARFLGRPGLATLDPGSGKAASATLRATLPNGMTVVVRESAGAPVVALTLFVGVGSRDETAERNGVTALLGRTLLKGTRTRSALEVAQAAEDAGGVLESATDQEYSELRARGLGRHWPALLALLHEVATSPGLAATEVERERQALLAQIRGLDDQPFQVANRLLSRALYGTHPYALSAAGELASVTRLGGDDLRGHFETFYTPDRMVLAVSGQVAGEAVLREAAEAFRGSARGATAGALPPPPARPVTPGVREIRSTQQTHLLVGFLAPPLGHPDYVPLKVLTAVLGSGMSSRLFRALRDEAGLAYAVGAFYPTRRETSRLVLHIGTAPAHVTQAEAGLQREVARLREEPVPGEELERAKTFLTGSFALDLRTNARQTFYRGFFELMGVGHDYLARYAAEIEAVTAADLERVARRYLTESSTAVVGPD